MAGLINDPLTSALLAALNKPTRRKIFVSYHHGDDQPQLLHDLARVLECVDEKAEYEPGHDGQEGLVQQLRERLERQQQICQVHKSHEHDPGEHSPAEAAKRRLPAASWLRHLDWFTTWRYFAALAKCNGRPVGRRGQYNRLTP